MTTKPNKSNQQKQNQTPLRSASPFDQILENQEYKAS